MYTTQERYGHNDKSIPISDTLHCDVSIDSETSPEILYDEVGLFCDHKIKTDAAPDQENVYDEIELHDVTSGITPEDVYEEVGFPETHTAMPSLNKCPAYGISLKSNM